MNGDCHQVKKNNCFVLIVISILATSSVDKRRADVAARNEQRKQELIAKKQQTTHRLGIRKEQS
jgi:hypothetical protein